MASLTAVMSLAQHISIGKKHVALGFFLGRERLLDYFHVMTFWRNWFLSVLPESKHEKGHQVGDL